MLDQARDSAHLHLLSSIFDCTLTTASNTPPSNPTLPWAGQAIEPNALMSFANALVPLTPNTSASRVLYPQLAADDTPDKLLPSSILSTQPPPLTGGGPKAGRRLHHSLSLQAVATTNTGVVTPGLTPPNLPVVPGQPASLMSGAPTPYLHSVLIHSNKPRQDWMDTMVYATNLPNLLYGNTHSMISDALDASLLP